MKGLLIKLNDYYYLRESSKTGIGGAVCERTLGTTHSQGELGTLSKKNCDEIFGVVDVEKLAKEKYPNDGYADTTLMQKGFIQGAKEILELNKDKVFTLEDIKKAYCQGELDALKTGSYCEKENKFIQSLQRPSEIEVEIEQINKLNIDKGLFEWMPKLDENKCLILKRI